MIKKKTTYQWECPKCTGKVYKLFKGTVPCECQKVLK